MVSSSSLPQPTTENLPFIPLEHLSLNSAGNPFSEQTNTLRNLAAIQAYKPYAEKRNKQPLLEPEMLPSTTTDMVAVNSKGPIETTLSQTQVAKTPVDDAIPTTGTPEITGQSITGLFSKTWLSQLPFAKNLFK